jgi:hypothetical protein
MKRLEFIEHRFRSIYSEPRDDQLLPLEHHVVQEELPEHVSLNSREEERPEATSFEGCMEQQDGAGQIMMSTPVDIMMSSQLSRIRAVLAMATLSSEEKVARIAAIVDSCDH